MRNKLLLLGLIGSLTACQAQPVKSDAETIMSWWSGDYNNDVQLDRLTKTGKPIWGEDGTGKGGHIEVTSHYRPIDLPAFGKYVIYVEETKHGKPDLIFRQRIYTVNENADTGETSVKLYYFNDKKKYVGAWKDLSRLKDLTPEDMFPLKDECDLAVIKQGNKFHMPMPAKSCVFGESYFNYQVLLGENSFWFRDRIMNVADDTPKESAGNFTYHELDKL